MSCAAVGVGVGALAGIGGAMISANATNNAAQTQANSATQAQQLQYQEWEQQQQNQAPWLQAGQSALSQMQNPAFQQNFTAADFQQDPGYQFDLQQGQLALQRSAAAQGGLQSGGTMKGLAQYTQGMASNEYQNAYNRFQQNKTTNFNQLASIAGLGQTANGQLGQAGQNYANNAANIAMSGANAQGAAQIAQGNIWGNALSGLGNTVSQGANNYMTNQMMNNMMGGGGNLQMPSFGSNLSSMGGGSAPGLNYGQGGGGNFFGLAD